MNEVVTVQFVATADERRRAAKQVAELAGRRLWRRPIVIGVILLLLVVLNPFHFNGSDWLEVAVWPVLILVLWFAWPRFLWWRNARRNGGEERRTVSQGGLEIAGAANITFPWSRIHSATETQDFVFFLLAPGAGHFIPKRVLDADDVEVIRALAGDKWLGVVSDS